VRGDFPDQDPYALFAMSDVEWAQSNELPPGLPEEAGIDVAGPGESETVCYVRQGPRIVDMMTSRLADPSGALSSFLLPRRERCLVKVDAVGLGYHLGLGLRKIGFNVKLLNAQGTPSRIVYPGEKLPAFQRFANAKAEWYWALRLAFKEKQVACLDDPITAAQLLSLTYDEETGKVQVTPKGKLRSVGKKSPDRAEALMLCFAPTRQGGFKVYT
jgi:hypothetical protein